ncbi:MAG: hypothetical protein IKO33_08225 [Bacteroidaceae bacterium]|nr:hypothetical protein [Bacteroidaceae bacterium]
MKKNLINILFVAFLSAIMFVSCDPMEPSTRTETLARYATVSLNGTKANLLFDGITETLRIKNFSTESDMEAFNVKDGDRVLATISVKTIDNTVGEVITLEYLSKINVLKFATEQPSDTLNYLFNFSQLEVGRTLYPEIWSQGHFVNIAPVVFARNSIKKAPKFSLYPLSIKKDTLITRLYSYFPESDCGNDYSSYQDVCCFDLSSLRDPVGDQNEQVLRDTLLARLGRIGSSFIIKVLPPDSVRTKYTMTDSVYTIKRKNLSDPVSASVSFDF